MEAVLQSDDECAVAASVGPEDLRCGDFIAVLSVIYEYPSFFWCSDGKMTPREEPVCVERRDSDNAAPLEIKAICLPLIFVKDAMGKHKTLDVRLCRLARLTSEFAKKVTKVMRKPAK